MIFVLTIIDNENNIVRTKIIGRLLITRYSLLKPSFHMVANVSRLCRKCRRDRDRVRVGTVEYKHPSL